MKVSCITSLCQSFWVGGPLNGLGSAILFRERNLTGVPHIFTTLPPLVALTRSVGMGSAISHKDCPEFRAVGSPNHGPPAGSKLWQQVMVASYGSKLWQQVMAASYGGKLWWQVMAASYGGKLWWQVMAASYGGKLWQQVMAASYGGKLWQQVMAASYGSKLWQQVMAASYGGKLWQQVMAASYGSKLWRQVMVASYGSKLWWQVMAASYGSKLWRQVMVASYGSKLWWQVMVANHGGKFTKLWMSPRRQVYDGKCMAARSQGPRQWIQGSKPGGNLSKSQALATDSGQQVHQITDPRQQAPARGKPTGPRY